MCTSFAAPVNAQVVTDQRTSCNNVVVKPIFVVTSREQIVITLLQDHFVTRLMTVPDLLQVVPTRLMQAVRNKLLYELVVMNLLTTCYVQTISNLLQQLVASLLASSTLLQDDNNLFQTNPQLGTRSCGIFTRVERI